MKKIIITFFVLVLLISSGCDESFNPFGEFKEKFVLMGIIRGDSLKQVATIVRNYPEQGKTQNINWVSDAEITVWQGDSVYVFRDSSTQIIDPVFGETTIEFFYHPNIRLEPGAKLEIEALLPDRRLISQTTVPTEIIFKRLTTVIPPVASKIQIGWNTVSPGSIYTAKFMIRYLKKINGINEEFLIEVPQRYIDLNGNQVPVYPVPDRNTTFIYEPDAVTEIMEKISEGDPQKNNYSVFQVPLIEVIVMDDNLSRYFSTTTGSFDDLTVRVNETDYSNVEGGLGIFGSYIKGTYSTVKLLPEYIQSFGYNVVAQE